MDYVSAICKKYDFPKVPWAYQRDQVNLRIIEKPDRAAYYWDMGAGKTFGATLHACIYRDMTGAQTVLTVPPILLLQWQKWLNACGISNFIYYGSAAERKAIKLDPNAEFMLTSGGVLKNDFDRLIDYTSKRKILKMVDEATSVKNFESGNYRAVLQMSAGQAILPLTGSPLATPRDAYAYIKLVSPSIYRSYTQFETIHVAEKDRRGNPIEWRRLEMMARNLAMHSSFVSTPEVHPDMPRANIQPIEYKLGAQHSNLYKQLVNDRLIVHENGVAIDATSAPRLHHALQQIVLNYGHFAQDAELKPEGFNLIDEYLLELRGKKLIIFANYKMSVKAIMEYVTKKGYKAVQVNGEISPTQNGLNLEQFKSDLTLQVAVMNPKSGGVGSDGIQDVCHHALFMEVPTLSKDFFQAVKRIERPGQRFICDIRVATAMGTIQVHLRKMLVENNGLVHSLVPTTDQLRAQLLGLA